MERKLKNNLAKISKGRQDLNMRFLLELKLIYEVLGSIYDARKYLREPHILDIYIKEMTFSEIYSKIEIIRNFQKLSANFRGIKSRIGIINDIDECDLLELFKYDGYFQKFIDRGQFSNVAIEIIEIIEKTEVYYNGITPSEIGKILNEILNVKDNEKLVDPTAGYGKLLYQVGGCEVYGYEINIDLADIGNIFLKIANKKGEIFINDSLLDNITNADVVICDPPYGSRVVENLEESYLQWGIPGKITDLYFLSLIIDKANSRGAIILPEGALFRGGQDKEVRKNIIEKGYIEGIISLPLNLMKHTSIATSLVIFNKEKFNEKIFFLDTKNMFEKVRGGVNIAADDLKKLIDFYKNFQEKEGVSKFITIKEILENDSVLNIIRYLSPLKKDDISIEDLEKDMKKLLNVIEKEKKLSNELLNEI